MEENKIVETNVESNESNVIAEKPKKKGNAAFVLGIIGTSTGVLALLLIIGGFFFRGARSNMMNNIRNDRNGRIEERGGFNRDGNGCRAFWR